MTDETQKIVFQLLAVGAPTFHRLAADKLTEVEAITPEDHRWLLEAVTMWLKTWRAIEFHVDQLCRLYFPGIRNLRRELAGDPADDDLGAAFGGEVEAIQAAAKRARLSAPLIRPSKVAQPGPLDDLAILRIATEDELRSAVQWGRTDKPLFEVDGRPYFGYGLREKLYLSRKIARLWGPDEPDPDRAIMQDYAALITLIDGRITSFSKGRRHQRIAPFVRRWQSWECWHALDDAVGALEKAGVLVRQRPRTWVVAADWVVPLREQLLKSWLDACGEVQPTR